MDPSTLSLAVASAVAAKAIEDAAGKVGDSLWQALTRVSEAIRVHFGHDQPILQALDRIQGQPGDEEAAKHLAGQLEDRFANDPPFADEVALLMAKLNSVPEAARFLTIIKDNAHVGKVTNISAIKGDVTF